MEAKLSIEPMVNGSEFKVEFSMRGWRFSFIYFWLKQKRKLWKKLNIAIIEKMVYI